MDRFAGRVALVTGTSSGIGAAIARDLVRAGMQVVGVARRVELVQGLAASLRGEGVSGVLHPLKADVSSEEEVKRIYDWIENSLHAGVSVVVNNAAILTSKQTQDIPDGDITKIINTNVTSVMSSCKHAVLSMKRHNIKDGHIININSVAGHVVPRLQGMSLSAYCGTKHALVAFGKGLRADVKCLAGFEIKVTSISPGGVETAMIPQEYIDLVKGQSLLLKATDISKAVVYALSCPPEVEIVELTIQATGEII